MIATLSSKTNGPLVEFAKAMSAIAATTASPLLQIGMLARLRLMTWHAVVSPAGLVAVCNTRSPNTHPMLACDLHRGRRSIGSIKRGFFDF